ncbi:MAG: hypothetical protein D6767_05710, partial [Candidatus Hydrogenedentota bacterium]
MENSPREREYRFLDLGNILPWIVFALLALLTFTVAYVFKPFLVSFFAALLIYLVFRSPHD